MSGRDHEPLTPEERGLALQLSRLEQGAAPSASLDARILASARRAGQAPTAAPASPPRPRWPVAMGLAASLLVAVGVAWQLRPQPDMQVPEAPSEAARAVSDGPIGVETPAPAPGAAPAEEAPVATGALPETSAARIAIEPRAGASTATDAEDRERAVLQAREASARDATAGEARTGEDAVVQAARARAAQMRQADPPPLAAPASGAAARAAAGSSPATVAAGAPAADQPTFAPPPPPPSPSPANPQPTTGPGASAPPPPAGRRAQEEASPVLDRIGVSGSRAAPPAAEVDVLADQPLDEEPPASADSPAVRESWLQRIRELRDDGRMDEARASLREFVRRHPQADVPADLRPLLDE